MPVDHWLRPAHLVMLDELKKLNREIVKSGDKDAIDHAHNRAIVVPAKTELLVVLLAQIELTAEDRETVSDGLRTVRNELEDANFEDRRDIEEYPNDTTGNERRRANIVSREDHIMLLIQLIEVHILP